MQIQWATARKSAVRNDDVSTVVWKQFGIVNETGVGCLRVNMTLDLVFAGDCHNTWFAIRYRPTTIVEEPQPQGIPPFVGQTYHTNLSNQGLWSSGSAVQRMCKNCCFVTRLSCHSPWISGVACESPLWVPKFLNLFACLFLRLSHKNAGWNQNQDGTFTNCSRQNIIREGSLEAWFLVMNGVSLAISYHETSLVFQKGVL